MSIQSRIQAALRYAIEQLGKQQVDLAREVGMTKSRISQLYHGDSGGVIAEKIFAIARATKCRAEWIVEGTGPMLESIGAEAIKIPLYGSTSNLNDHGRSMSRSLIEELGLNPKNIFYIIAQDDSMSTTINRGDLLLVDIQDKKPKSEDIFAIAKAGGLVIRRLIEPIFGGWIIRPDNDDRRRFRDEPLKAEDFYKVDIIGRIVWRGGKI